MRIKALVGFTGAFSMSKGQVFECDNEDILKDLLQAGYVEEVPEKGKVKNENKRSNSKTSS